MKNFKFTKFVAVMLVFVMLMAMLASCTGGNGGDTTAADTSTQAPTGNTEQTTGTPEETTKDPEETTKAPEETTKTPEETTKTPEETSKAPEQTTNTPDETTKTPEETTNTPETTPVNPPVVDPVDPNNLLLGTWMLKTDIAPLLLKQLEGELASMGAKAPENVDPIYLTMYFNFDKEGVMKLFVDDSEIGTIGDSIASIFIEALRPTGYLQLMLTLGGMTEEEFRQSMAEEFNASFSAESFNTKGFYRYDAASGMVMISEIAENLCEKDGFYCTVSASELVISKFVNGGEETDVFMDMVELPVTLVRSNKEVPEIEDRPIDPPAADGEAEIDGTVYPTLAEAIAAAKDGDKIELLTDVELTAPITVDKNISIEGWFNTVTVTGVEGDVFVVTGALSVEDVDFVFLAADSASGNCLFSVRSGGSLVLDYCEIELENATAVYGAADSVADVEIIDCSIDGAGTSAGFVISGIVNLSLKNTDCDFALGDIIVVRSGMSGSSVEIDGGWFSAGDETADCSSSKYTMFAIDSKCDFIVKDGTFTVSDSVKNLTSSEKFPLFTITSNEAVVRLCGGSFYFTDDAEKDFLCSLVDESCEADVGWFSVKVTPAEPSDIPSYDPTAEEIGSELTGVWKMEADITEMLKAEFAEQGINYEFTSPVTFTLYFYFGEDHKGMMFADDEDLAGFVEAMANGSFTATKTMFGDNFAALLAAQGMTEEQFLEMLIEEFSVQYSAQNFTEEFVYDVDGNLIRISVDEEGLADVTGMIYRVIGENTITVEAFCEEGAVSAETLFGMLPLPCDMVRTDKKVPVVEEKPAEADLSDRVMSEDYEYARPDYEELNTIVDGLIERINAGTEDVDSVQADYEALEEKLYHSYTMSSIVSMRQSEDVSNTFWADESLWLSEQSSALFVKLVALDVAAFDSDKYRDALLGEMSEEEIHYLEIMKKLADDEYVALSTEESELENRYLSAEVDVRITVDGVAYNYDELEDAGLDEKYGSEWWDAYVNYVGEILLQMVTVRNKIANKAGYDNYADYAYEIVYERDYGPEEAAQFAEAVKEHLINLAFSNVYNFTYPEVNFINNNYYGQPGYDFADYIEIYKEYFASISPEMAENFEKFLADSNYSIGSETNRQEGAYTTYLYDYEHPYIFMYLYGGAYDTSTLIHEFGHYNAFCIHGTELGSSIDICELHSQMDEILFLPTWNKILDESKALAIKKFEIYVMANTVLSGCQEDEFQRLIYTQPEKYNSVEALCKLYGELNEKYAGGDDDTNWANIRHTFEVPFYYISYAVSAVPAMELFVLSERDYDAAVELYLKLVEAGTDYNFSELMDYVSLGSPFSIDAMKSLASGISVIFSVRH